MAVQSGAQHASQVLPRLDVEEREQHRDDQRNHVAADRQPGHVPARRRGDDVAVGNGEGQYPEDSQEPPRPGQRRDDRRHDREHGRQNNHTEDQRLEHLGNRHGLASHCEPDDAARREHRRANTGDAEAGGEASPDEPRARDRKRQRVDDGGDRHEERPEPGARQRQAGRQAERQNAARELGPHEDLFGADRLPERCKRQGLAEFQRMPGADDGEAQPQTETGEHQHAQPHLHPVPVPDHDAFT